jgi:cytochrome c oxidase subunit 4
VATLTTEAGATTPEAGATAPASVAAPGTSGTAPVADGPGTTGPVESGGHPAHPAGGVHLAQVSEAQYMLIALILAVITAVEVGISYAKGLGDAAAPLLLALAATKFAIVVGYFMHLRYEKHILRRIFATGIALAIVIYFILFLTLGVFTGSHGVHS